MPTRRTILHGLLDVTGEDAAKLALDQDRLEKAAVADALNLIGAAVETTGATAEKAMYEILRSAEIYQQLTAELRGSFAREEDMSVAALERLPFLTAVVKEALRFVLRIYQLDLAMTTGLTRRRLGPGTPGRFPRVVPATGAELQGKVLPPGTVVSLSVWDM